MKGTFGALLAVVVLVAVVGCDEPKSQRASSETKVLETLGSSSVEGVTLLPKVGTDQAVVDRAFDAIMAGNVPLAQRIEICRTTPNGTPAELHLAQPYEVADVEATFGPPGKTQRRRYSETGNDIDFYTYGNLEIGVSDGKVVVVVVNK